MSTYFDQKMIIGHVQKFADQMIRAFNESRFPDRAQLFLQDKGNIALLLYVAMLLMMAGAILTIPPEEGLIYKGDSDGEENIYVRKRRYYREVERMNPKDILNRHPMITRSMVR
jgi:hypothetical protein